MMKVILITGAGSGIGYETAAALAAQGYRVYGGIRKPENAASLQQHHVIPITLDVTSEALCQKAVDAIIRAEGRLDVLINNAGYGSFGAVEDIPLSEAKRQFEVNVFGLARLTQLALPYMRKQRGGKIINVSSVGGKMVSYMGAWYHARNMRWRH